MPSKIHFIDELPVIEPYGEFIRVSFPTGRVHVYRPSTFQNHIDACQSALDAWFIQASRHRAILLPARKHLRSEPPALLDESDIGVKRGGGDPSA